MNTQWHTTIKDMAYKLVFGQPPRGALFPDAAKHIVQEEYLQGITDSKESAEPVLPTTTSDTMKEKAPQTWVVKKAKVLTWTSSPASSPPISPKHRDSPIPSPPACLKQPEASRTLALLAHVSPTSSTSSSSSGLPSLPSSPVIVETIIAPPSAVIPAATITSAAPDHLAFENLSSREKDQLLSNVRSQILQKLHMRASERRLGRILYTLQLKCSATTIKQNAPKQMTSRKVIWFHSWFLRLIDVAQIYKGFQV